MFQSRLQAAKSYLANVERLISYSNIQKTSERSSLLLGIIRDSLYMGNQICIQYHNLIHIM